MSEVLAQDRSDTADISTISRRLEAAFPASKGSADGLSLDAVMNIPVTVQIVLGSTTVPVADLMRIARGAVIPLDHRVGDPVDVVVNGRVVARGQLVVMDEDNSRFGVSLTEIVSAGAPAERPA